MRQDALRMSLLFDYYGELLTEKQRRCFDLYYNQDLSLSEIADEAGVTRQGVHDTLSRAAALLEDCERKLGCIRQAQRVQAAVGRIRAAADALASVPGAQTLARQIMEAAGELAGET